MAATTASGTPYAVLSELETLPEDWNSATDEQPQLQNGAPDASDASDDTTGTPRSADDEPYAEVVKKNPSKKDRIARKAALAEAETTKRNKEDENAPDDKIPEEIAGDVLKEYQTSLSVMSADAWKAYISALCYVKMGQLKRRHLIDFVNMAGGLKLEHSANLDCIEAALASKNASDLAICLRTLPTRAALEQAKKNAELVAMRHQREMAQLTQQIAALRAQLPKVTQEKKGEESEETEGDVDTSIKYMLPPEVYLAFYGKSYTPEQMLDWQERMELQTKRIAPHHKESMPGWHKPEARYYVHTKWLAKYPEQKMQQTPAVTSVHFLRDVNMVGYGQEVINKATGRKYVKRFDTFYPGYTLTVEGYVAPLGWGDPEIIRGSGNEPKYFLYRKTVVSAQDNTTYRYSFLVDARTGFAKSGVNYDKSGEEIAKLVENAKKEHEQFMRLSRTTTNEAVSVMLGALYA
jgi:hypothetical protein